MTHSMNQLALRRPLQWLFGDWGGSRAGGRERELLRLAADVEPEDPGLAAQLRGMALHEAAAPQHRVPAAAPQRGVPAAESAWRRAGVAVWEVLQAVGHRRADREIERLMAQWSAKRPDMARELRAALRRGD